MPTPQRGFVYPRSPVESFFVVFAVNAEEYTVREINDERGLLMNLVIGLSFYVLVWFGFSAFDKACQGF